MPIDVAADGLEELRRLCSAHGPLAPQRLRAESERQVYECIEKAVEEVPKPSRPSNLMDYGFPHGHSGVASEWWLTIAEDPSGGEPDMT